MNNLSPDPKWWQKVAFYQIYPRSYADGNGDGIGDFQGMLAKLDYLRELGIGAIWLSPHYPSPFLDCGYDISDYTNVAPEYGTLDDFHAFLQAAHARELHVILDLVLNHTSDQHPWFLESHSSLDNPKRDWYIWRDGQEDWPPNNWASIFGGSAWKFDPTTGQYYYHAFLEQQPDLNWRNPQVKHAMWQVVRFWLDLGVDGFRLDAVSTIFEHPDLPDHTLPKSADEILDANALSMADYQRLMHFQLNQPGIHELMQELRAIMNEYPGDRMLIGEDEDPAYHGSGDDELQLVFNFPLMRRKPLTPVSIRANQARRLGELPPGSWPCNTLGNHDSPRLWSHYGDGAHNAEIAQLHLALILTLKGTPFLYYGEEIGMTDLELISLEQIRDSKALKQYQQMTERLGIAPEAALKAALANTRDRCRTPMQWNTSANAGFSPPGIQTWLPVNPNYAIGVNVAGQESDQGSLLNFYRRLLRLRQATPALNSGEYEVLHPHSKTYLAFLRHAWLGDQTCLVVLNFSNELQEIRFGLCIKPARLLFSSHERENVPISLDPLSLAPYEICIIDVSDFRD